MDRTHFLQPNFSPQAHVFLRNKNWNTRTAAGQAIEAISAAIPVWNPVSVKNEATIKAEPDVAGAGETVSHIGRFDFETFDPVTVLRNGKLLLASTGAEFVISRDQMDPKSLAEQRKNIKMQFGGEVAAFMADIADDADLMAVDSVPQTKTEYVVSLLPLITFKLIFDLFGLISPQRGII